MSRSIVITGVLGLLAACHGSPQAVPDRPAGSLPVDAGVRDQGADLSAAPSPKMIVLEPGTFTMGSPPEEPCRRDDESLHPVKLTRRFEIQSTEITQRQFTTLLGYVPFSSCGLDCPAVDVSWSEAAAYCNALSQQARLEPCYACTGSGASVLCTVAPAFATPASSVYSCPGYRLPTEAEWEYAYRAGSSSALYDGAFGASCASDPNADSIGWYRGNAGGDIHPVGMKAANGWGLFDMAGNAIEFVDDFYVDDLGTSPVTDPVIQVTDTSWHILRGGSFIEDADRMRAARRDHCDGSGGSDIDIGFRVVRTLP